MHDQGKEIKLTCAAKRTSRCAGSWTGPQKEARRLFRLRYNAPTECWQCVYAGTPVSKSWEETNKEADAERRRRQLAAR